MRALVLAATWAAGCGSSVEHLVAEGRLAEAVRATPEPALSAGQEVFYQDETAPIARAAHAGSAASVRAVAWTADDVRAVLGDVPADYGSRWLVVGLTVDTASVEGLADVHVAVQGPDGAFLDVCRGERCGGAPLLLATDHLFGVERSWGSDRESVAAGVAGGLSAFLGAVVDTPVWIGTFGQVSMGAGRIPGVAVGVASSPGLGTAVGGPSAASERLYALIRHDGDLLPRGVTPRLKLLVFEPGRPAGSSLARDVLTLVVEYAWWPNDGRGPAVARTRSDVPLPPGDTLPARVRAGFGEAPRRLTDLDAFASPTALP